MTARSTGRFSSSERLPLEKLGVGEPRAQDVSLHRARAEHPRVFHAHDTLVARAGREIAEYITDLALVLLFDLVRFDEGLAVSEGLADNDEKRALGVARAESP